MPIAKIVCVGRSYFSLEAFQSAQSHPIDEKRWKISLKHKHFLLLRKKGDDMNGKWKIDPSFNIKALCALTETRE